MIKGILKVVGTLGFTVLIILVGLSIFLTINSKANPNEIPSIFGYMPLTVLSNSMYPALEAGDMIFTKNAQANEVEKGDVITFKEADGRIVTHRVIKVMEQNGSLQFQTKGDNNNVMDDSIVTEQQLLGNLSFTIPYAGIVAKFAASKTGAILFFGVPMMLYLIIEASERMKRRKNKKVQAA